MFHAKSPLIIWPSFIASNVFNKSLLTNPLYPWNQLYIQNVGNDGTVDEMGGRMQTWSKTFYEIYLTQYQLNSFFCFYWKNRQKTLGNEK